uniref:Uncharacterized protein n=1 Tax=Aegilops tauschii subsp. strangulata TaxID=200361 RepID=A0A453Q534_AEGTS
MRQPPTPDLPFSPCHHDSPPLSSHPPATASPAVRPPATTALLRCHHLRYLGYYAWLRFGRNNLAEDGGGRRVDFLVQSGKSRGIVQPGKRGDKFMFVRQA